MTTVSIRPVQPEDAEACARIVFEAFGAIHDHHRFERDFPVLEAATGTDEYVDPSSGRLGSRRRA